MRTPPLESLIDQVAAAYLARHGRPGDVRIYRYDGSDADRAEFWDADVIFDAGGSLSFSDEVGESDTIDGALIDLLASLGAEVAP